MNDIDRTRILIIPDKIWGEDSGAVSARFTVATLRSMGYRVGVYANDDGHQGERRELIDVDYFERPKSSTSHHFIGRVVKTHFEETIVNYRPDYAFFVGMAVNKPIGFFDACLQHRIPFALLFYINDYYCLRIYAGLAAGPCFKCIGGNYLHAFVNGCHRARSGRVGGCAGVIVRQRLAKVLHRCHRVVGYSEGQCQLYVRNGYRPEKCIRSPVHFDPSRIVGVGVERGDYFLLCGQSMPEKGWHVMAEVIRLCPSAKFRLVFPTLDHATREVSRFGLREFQHEGRIKIETNIVDHRRLLSLVAGARGVLIPSYYPTTGEFILMETLGLGKPAIVFDAGIHGEVIRSGHNGLMAQIGDIAGFAHHVNRLVTSVSLYDEVSKGAISLFQELTSPERLHLAMHEIFGDPITTKRPGVA